MQSISANGQTAVSGETRFSTSLSRSSHIRSQLCNGEILDIRSENSPPAANRTYGFARNGEAKSPSPVPRPSPKNNIPQMRAAVAAAISSSTNLFTTIPPQLFKTSFLQYARFDRVYSADIPSPAAPQKYPTGLFRIPQPFQRFLNHIGISNRI
jgi:hypothetical protein